MAHQTKKASWALHSYLVAAHLIPVVAPLFLRRRLAQGKEDPMRWREKIGKPSLPRPKGRLIWLHAVGLGEVLSLRAIITSMAEQMPDLSFLITSSARSSANVIARNLPKHSIHQYLPLDGPNYMKRFLDHWRPDLSIWAEQDIWPGAIAAADQRGVPLALINVRLTSEGLTRRKRAKILYHDILSRFSLMAAQDQYSANNLMALGAKSVGIIATLKAAAPALQVNPSELSTLQKKLAKRRIWFAASTHCGDEREIIAAAKKKHGANWLLIIAPRDISRTGDISMQLRREGIRFVCRSRSEIPDAHHQIWLADTYGEMGLWYRLAEVALIGGGFGDGIGGHNPWEAVALDCPVLHGPDISNFRNDYTLLDTHRGACALGPGMLAQVLRGESYKEMPQNARALADGARLEMNAVAKDLLSLIE